MLIFFYFFFLFSLFSIFRFFERWEKKPNHCVICFYFYSVLFLFNFPFLMKIKFHRVLLMLAVDVVYSWNQHTYAQENSHKYYTYIKKKKKRKRISMISLCKFMGEWNGKHKHRSNCWKIVQTFSCWSASFWIKIKKKSNRIKMMANTKMSKFRCTQINFYETKWQNKKNRKYKINKAVAAIIDSLLNLLL